ncbi:MAG TPA: PilZ domain-containing protein, partial [Candidatus Baltobacteraceae bacterium]|nr:PilZ domain-containing protein [Candidatus Baltobacteraceae bacterium]
LSEKTTESLECPTMIRVAGAAPAMAIVEHLTPAECRMRSVAVFRPGDSAEFDFVVKGAPRITVRGRIASCQQSGPRRVYFLALAAIDRADADAIIVAVGMVRRNAAMRATPDLPTDNGLTRASVRVAADFEVHYRIGDDPERTARAENISTGGILMTTGDALPVGSSLELRFTLPGAANDLTVNARIVAHQQTSPNYNLAFHSVAEPVREAIARFVSR